MKPCVRDTTARSLGYAAYLSHELPRQARKAARCRLAEVLAERWWPVRCRWWCLTAPSRAVWGSTDAGAHDGVPKQPPGMSGDMGEYSDGRGRVAHPPCRYHAAHGCAYLARTGGSPWGLRTCPINRARRVAKRNRNRQGPTNNVPFPRGRTLWHPFGEMRRLRPGRLRRPDGPIPGPWAGMHARP